MSLPRIEVDLGYVSKLDDNPNDVGGLDAAELKAVFDKAGLTLQEYINTTLIPQIESDIEAAALGIGGGGQIGIDKLPDKSIGTAKLEDGSVTTPILADGSVTEKKIVDTSVTSSKIADSAVTTAKIADNAVTREKIPDQAISAAKIFPGAVGTSHVAAKAITADKLAADAKSTGVAVTLTAGGWSSKAQTVNVEGVTADNNIIVAAAPASREAWNDAEIYCSAQADGTLTFTCGTAPTVEVTANVVIIV